jgi:cold shock protein
MLALRKADRQRREKVRRSRLAA